MNNKDGHFDACELKDAFQVFNQFSQQLTTSYRLLEEQVCHLTLELAAARHERLQQLNEKERLANRLQGLLAALPAGVIVLDDKGVIKEFNPAAQSILGGSLLGYDWSEIVQQVFVDPICNSNEYELKNGRVISVCLSPLHSEQGSILLLNDVTENKLLQNKLSRQEQLTAIGEMTAGLAHQIRTPLAAVLLYVSHLSNKDLTQYERQRFVQKAISRLRYLDRTVTDMLIFARGGPFTMKEISICSLLNELQLQIEESMQARSAYIQISGISAGIKIKGNLEALINALANLIVNALDVAPEKSLLRLHVSIKDHTWAVLSLSDSGPGIPDSIKDRIFDPFFTTRPNGFGLGLAVVKKIISAHRGYINVVSQVGIGTTFAIHLPLDLNANVNARNQEGHGDLKENNTTSFTGVVT